MFIVRSTAAWLSPTSTETPRGRPPPPVTLPRNSPMVGEVSPGSRVPPWDRWAPSTSWAAIPAMLVTTGSCMVVAPRSLCSGWLSRRRAPVSVTAPPPFGSSPKTWVAYPIRRSRRYKAVHATVVRRVRLAGCTGRVSAGRQLHQSPDKDLLRWAGSRRQDKGDGMYDNFAGQVIWLGDQCRRRGAVERQAQRCRVCSIRTRYAPCSSHAR